MSVVSCIGSLTSATLRMANAAATDAAKGANEVRTRHEKFEIVSMHGTVEYDPAKDRVTRHIHLALSDKNGACWGGHVMSKREGGGATDELQLLPIYTTAEVTLLVQHDVVFDRAHCELSGWPELRVRSLIHDT